MVTPVVCPRRHQRLLPVGWPVDGASCQASANYARDCQSFKKKPELVKIELFQHQVFSNTFKSLNKFVESQTLKQTTSLTYQNKSNPFIWTTQSLAFSERIYIATSVLATAQYELNQVRL
jgi:hypothetical protein